MGDGPYLSIRDSLIRAAGRTLDTELGAANRGRIIELFCERQNRDGVFNGKGKQSDLYYTGFAVLSLLAMRADFDFSTVIGYLRTFGHGDGLDLAHLASLVRCCVLLAPDDITTADRQHLADNLRSFQCDDGGYHHVEPGKRGSAYGCFLALGAYEDLGIEFDPSALLESLALLKSKRAYYNEPAIPAPTVPATEAAIVIRQTLAQPIIDHDQQAFDWLMQCCGTNGGFWVMKIAPLADMLSTAVALHALDKIGADISRIHQPCMEYMRKCWRLEVGFCSNTIDRWTDCEYMYYGLLALGHLSEPH